MDRTLRQRFAAALPSRPLRLGTFGVPEISLPWATTRNRQKVLGFAALAVSLVLISGPFLLNVDSDVVAKAQTVSVEPSTKTVEVITEMVIAEDVIVALNATRTSGNLAPAERDEQLQTGAQAWAAIVAEQGNVRTDRSLRALLSERLAVGEFVVAAPSLSVAYQRLMAIQSQDAQLTAASTRKLGVGVHSSGNKTYLVLRFAS